MIAPSDSQIPPATLALLNGLQPAHIQAFPVSSRPVVKRDGGDDDSLEGRASLTQQDALIRTVVGGRLAALAAEEGANGGHNDSSGSTITALLAAVVGPVQHCLVNPSSLLFRPSSTLFDSMDARLPLLNGAATSSSFHPAPDDAAAEEDVDLAGYLFPRLIRAMTSLEAALLSTDRAEDMMAVSDEDDALVLHRLREQARDQLEKFMVTIVQSLSEGGAGLEWDNSEGPVQGGVGRARKLVHQMIDMLRSRFSSLPLDAIAIPMLHPADLSLIIDVQFSPHPLHYRIPMSSLSRLGLVLGQI